MTTQEQYIHNIPKDWQIGDKVRILRKAKSYENGWDDYWPVGPEYDMNRSIGTTGVILNIDLGRGFNVRYDKSSAWDRFPHFVLENLSLINRTMKINSTVKIKPDCQVSPIGHTPDSTYTVKSINGNSVLLNECDTVQFNISQLEAAQERWKVNDVVVHIESGAISIVNEVDVDRYYVHVEGHANSLGAIDFSSEHRYQKIDTCDFRIGNWVVDHNKTSLLGYVVRFYIENDELYFCRQCEDGKYERKVSQFKKLTVENRSDVKGLSTNFLISELLKKQ